MSETTTVEKTDDDKAPPKPRSIFDLYETNADEEESGKWFNDAMGDGNGVDLKLRRLSSKFASRVRVNLDKQYARHIKDGVYTDDEIGIKVLARHIGAGVIADWRGPAFINEDGSPMPYSADAATLLMERLPDLRLRILNLAMPLENFRLNSLADTEKN